MSFTVSSNTLADRFGWLFDGLCKTIGVEAYRHAMEAALAWAVWNRVRVLGERLDALLARVRGGRLRRRGTPRARAGAADTPDAGIADADALHPGPSPQRARKKLASLPREFGWVRRALPETGQFAGVLRLLLRDPETVALVERAPEAGRILRPLCHLLGVETPAFLRRRGGVESLPADPLASDPPPLPDSPRMGSEGNGSGNVIASEAAVTPQPPPPPAPPPPRYADWRLDPNRPGGLYWDRDANRWAWS